MTQVTDRPTLPAVRRGFRRRCPRCGAGALFDGYLRVRDHCPACGEDLFHQQADDGPAYVTILIVGHLMAPAILIAFLLWRPDPLVLATTMGAACVALALWLLPRLKGVIVGFQWAHRMHGFGEAPDDPA
jgi:uncharacterized protein (DUF983 family)